MRRVTLAIIFTFILVKAGLSAFGIFMAASGGGGGGSDPTVGVLPSYNDAYANWKNAGLQLTGGIPTRSTACSTLTPVGGSSSDASQINSAITACTAGQVVQLNAGAFLVPTANSPIFINKGITVRGSGSCTNQRTSTVTITNASPAVITWSAGAHNLKVNQPVDFTTTSGLPTGLTAYTTYYVMSAGLTTNAFQVSAAPGGSAVNTSSAGSGTHTGVRPLCDSVIVMPDGAIPFTGSCGTPSACNNANAPGVFLGNNSAGIFIPYWSGCNYNVSPGNCIGTAATLTSDAAQGDTVLNVSSTAHFAIGSMLLIDEASNGSFQTDPTFATSQVWASSDAFNVQSGGAIAAVIWEKHNPMLSIDDFGTGGTNTPANFNGAGAGCYPSFGFCDRPTAELHKITAIGTGTITIDDPLTIAYRASGGHNAQVYYPSDSSGNAVTFASGAGIEKVTIEQTAGGRVVFQACTGCWSDTVEVFHWFTGGINMGYAHRILVNNNYIHECTYPLNTGAEYPIDVKFASTEIMIINSITELCGKGMTFRSSGAGSVVAYNYLDHQYYGFAIGGVSDVLSDSSINGSHAAGSHHVLFEGNQGNNISDDDTHGSEFLHTYFRNWTTALRGPFLDPTNGVTVNDTTNLPSGNYPLRGISPMAYVYWMGFVGNVIGTSGQTTTGNGWSYRATYSGTTKAMWMPGWIALSGNDTNLNVGSGYYYFKNGNYDYVTASVSDCVGGAFSCTLPNSFYLAPGSSAPSFFTGASCTYPWPWVTPAGGSQIQTNSCSGSGLPAKARWDAGTALGPQP